MAQSVKLPYIAWRDGRPRFQPGPRERALGFQNLDLRHGRGGAWFTYEEARAFAETKRDEITAARGQGRKRRAPPAIRGRAVGDLWQSFERSDDYRGNAAAGIRGLAPSTQSSYRRFVRPLQLEPLWQAPVTALTPEILKGVHRKLISARGLSSANAAIAALSAALSWGRLNGAWLRAANGQPMPNPAHNLDLAAPPPRLRVLSDTEMTALVAAADATMLGGLPLSAVGDAVLLAFFSGQRKGDVLALVEAGTARDRIRLRQQKTGAQISIPMAPRLIERIGQARARRARLELKVEAPHIVINENIGLPYNGATFTTHFALVRKAAIAHCASLADATFPDLRDTAVTWYARAGCTLPEIASITGHSLGSIHSILKHYLSLDEHLADQAVRKLVGYMEREGLAV